MTTDASWAIQVSPKLPDGTLVNVRAATPQDLEQMLSWVEANSATIVRAAASLTTVGQVPALAQMAAPGGVSVQQGPPAQQQGGGWGQQPPVQQAPDFYSKQQPQDWQPQGQGPKPSCRHGERTFRTGTGKNNKPWQAWFCPSSNRNDQCEVEWVR